MASTDQLAAATRNIEAALTSVSSGDTQWQDVIIGYAPKNITSVGYDDPWHVHVIYYCKPGRSCPSIDAIRQGILDTVDPDNPTGGTVQDHLTAYGISDLVVEIVDYENEVFPANVGRF
jgi:hypothetical protein